MDIEELRRNYETRSLEAGDLMADPIQQFQAWFDECLAIESPDWLEPNVMTLATADTAGRVSARIVLLKKITQNGFVFFTNYESEKAIQLEANPHASLVFFWPHMERQVRVEGVVAKTDAALSDEYFHSRPRGSQCGAVASPQSRPIEDRFKLESQATELEQEYKGKQIPRPEYWGGFELQPNRLEFWQGRPSRLHDRICFQRAQVGEGSWQVSRLAP